MVCYHNASETTFPSSGYFDDVFNDAISVSTVAWWGSCLRHCSIIRKVEVSFPDGVIGIFNWSNPSSRTMVLRSTQPLTEMSTSNLPGDHGRPARMADNTTTIHSWKCGSLDVSQPCGPSRPVTGIALPFMCSNHVEANVCVVDERRV
jgi:hypothetical protein